MKKNKKKKAAKKATLLGGAAKSLKKLGKGSVGKLSTTQKVIAGATLGALGVRYLVKKLGKPTTTADTDYASAGASNDTFGTATDE
ncbi:hypothetical protein GCM10023172_23760 [Hymenobacter ginsengisoli]|uniref:DUF4235 domain-containing protein n=1 Tax=Hymenobacter ginsengisoli TaxID=1051626 RepID=A0ABP8QH13_9BACT|nr:MULTISPECIES: hypothetical protein [unclassified Hymenobacter]MBO2033230.1 hypothetical protein [Hymenobacter sp. BT559]